MEWIAMNKIGIMQGRLSPPINNKIQAFPQHAWEEEFFTAKQIGFKSIEFIFEKQNYKNNPLWTDEGLDKINQLVDCTGVSVDHVCADYFMECPFIRVSEEEREKSINILKVLIKRCARIGIKGIEIPMVDNSKIETESEKEVVVKSLRKIIPIIEEDSMETGLETSLAPLEFKDLLEKINHPLIKANYDTGNSASLGYDTREEIIALGKWISNVHIKDRILNGKTVPLGTGNADFDKSFWAFKEINYSGAFILQAARADGDEIENAKRNYEFVKNLVSKYLTEE